MSAITIDHHRTAYAHCQDCPEHWRTGPGTLVEAVLARAAEHAITTGHTVTERVADDIVVHPS